MLSTVVNLIAPAHIHVKDLLGALDYMGFQEEPWISASTSSKTGIGHSFRYADEYTQLGSLGHNYHLGQTFCSGQDNLSSGTALSLSTFFWHYYTTACFLLISLSRQRFSLQSENQQHHRQL